MAKTAKKIDQAAKAAYERAQAFEANGMNPTSSLLPANESIVVQRNTQKTAQTARREDAFDSLKQTLRAEAYNAARRLERDMRTNRGEDDRGIQHTGSVSIKGPMDRKLEAGDRIRAARKLMAAGDAWLLTELIYPSQDRTHWRLTVAYVTGEENPVFQGTAVRMACENLAEAYRKIDGGRR